MDKHMLFDMRHDYIPLNLRKYKNVAENHFLAPKNHLPGGFSALSCCNHIEFGQLPISSTRWTETCCLICDMTIFLWFLKKEIKGRQKITFRAVFLLFLNGITSNPAKYQLGTLDGWRHGVWYATWPYCIIFLPQKNFGAENHFLRLKKAPFLDSSRIYLYEIVSKQNKNYIFDVENLL